jgi:hypothetical protein
MLTKADNRFTSFIYIFNYSLESKLFTLAPLFFGGIYNGKV